MNETILRLLQFLRRDDLTGFHTLKAGGQALERELRRARKRGQPVSVVFMDVDNLKAVNDRLGHIAGNRILAQVGGILRRHARARDTVCRYGGDEFFIVLPAATIREAASVAERMRAEIEKTCFSQSTCFNFTVTASFGVAEFPRHADTAERLLQRADEAMYCVKSTGKNDICLAADKNAGCCCASDIPLVQGAAR